MSAKIGRNDILAWKGLLKEFEPKLHSGNPHVLVNEIDVLLDDRGYTSIGDTRIDRTELRENIKTYSASIIASKSGATSASALKALSGVGAIIALIGFIVLLMPYMMSLGLIMMIIGLVIVVIGLSAKPKAPVGTIGVHMNGFVYPMTIKEKEEASYLSFELRITVGAVTSRESKETGEPKKGDPVREDFDAVCDLIKSYLR